MVKNNKVIFSGLILLSLGLFFTSCTQPSNPSLVGKWRLVSLYHTKVLAQGKKEYFLKINSKDARFSAFAGCNNISGNYIMPSSNTIDFSDVIMTRMACSDMTLEDKFGAMLVQVKRYKINNELLTFFGEGKKVVAQFQAIK